MYVHMYMLMLLTPVHCIVTVQTKEVRLSNEELKQALAKSLKSIDKLTSERTTMAKQLEQQAL